MKEQDIQKKIQKVLEDKYNCYVVKVIQAARAGVPDLLVCYKGEFFGVEVKTPKTRTNVSELQKYNLEKIKKAGGKSYVVSAVEELDEIFK